jgi:TusA-related sulfurtransferase
MPLKIQVVRSNKDGRVRAQTQIKNEPDGEILAVVLEDKSGINTIAALISDDSEHGKSMREALEELCTKMIALGMEIKPSAENSCPAFPPP